MDQNNIISLKKQNETIIVNKKIIIPFEKSELESQHSFIKYLHDHNIKVANIISLTKKGDYYYEEQEFIKSDNSKISTDELILTIAKFHNASEKYDKPLLKQKVYSCKFGCNNVELNHLLLGFCEKYYIYPKESLKKKYNLIEKHNMNIITELEKKYDNCYTYFLNNYNISNCIIHNDITSNNVIKNDKGIYLIDFDLAIKSSVYVDFIDCVVKRYYTINELSKEFDKNQLNLEYYIYLYNKYNDNIKLDLLGSLCVLILKILSFNFYVLLNEKNAKKFNKDINDINKFINNVYEYYKEVKSDNKRCKY